VKKYLSAEKIFKYFDQPINEHRHQSTTQTQVHTDITSVPNNCQKKHKTDRSLKKIPPNRLFFFSFGSVDPKLGMGVVFLGAQ